VNTPEKIPAAPAERLAYLRGEPLDGSQPGDEVAWDQLTYGQALDRCTEKWGERELLVLPERRWTVREFAGEVERCARGLLRLGIERGEHVATLMPNVGEYAIAEMALARLGAAMVPVNLRYRADEIAYVLQQSDATTLLFSPQFGKADYLAMLRSLAPELDSCAPGKLACAALPRLKRILVAGEAAAGTVSFAQVLEMGAGAEWQRALAEREALVRADDVFILQYTSGTTAFPKAAMLRHGQTLRNAYNMARRAGIGQQDRVLSAMPMFHVGGSVCALLGAITTGYRLYLNPVFDAGETLGLIESEKITTYIGLESMFQSLRADPEFTHRSRASLTRGWSAGTTPVLRMVAEEIGIRNICSLYGLSEASPNVCISDWREPYEKRVTTMGRPQPDVEVKIIDTETQRTLCRGEEGEICVRGWSVMAGYYNLPDETSRAIDGEKWLYTGDRGKIDDDGYLIWTGRIKDMIRVGGENVSVLEVENLLCSHAKIHAAAVFGVPDPKLTEVGFAFVQLKPGERATEEEIIRYCRARAAVFKVPKYVRFVTSFEMTGSGKIQKVKMRERALAECGQEPATS
jgi:fatty-acyl-CoA synthase